jgi:hypothetical protein
VPVDKEQGHDSCYQQGHGCDDEAPGTAPAGEVVQLVRQLPGEGEPRVRVSAVHDSNNHDYPRAIPWCTHNLRVRLMKPANEDYGE